MKILDFLNISLACAGLMTAFTTTLLFIFRKSSRSNILDVMNSVVVGLGVLASIMSISVLFLTRSADRQKDREMAAEKIRTDLKIQQARTKAEIARKDAEFAKSDAERARLETAVTKGHLLITQERLNAANRIDPLSDQQVEGIANGFLRVSLDGAQPLWTAARDRQAELRLQQVSYGLLKVELRAYIRIHTGGFLKPSGESGDVIIHYWSENRKKTSISVAKIFQDVGLVTHVYKQPPEPDANSRPETLNLILISFPARRVPKFN